MTDESTESTEAESLDAVAGRLEAALERIVRHMEAGGPSLPRGEIALRLDRLIARLRDVIGAGDLGAGDLGAGDPGRETSGEEAGDEEAANEEHMPG